MDFDFTTSMVTTDDVQIDYGILRGNNDIVFIKSGKGGSCRGYKDKYIKMADRIRTLYGNTVICSSNPENSRESFSCDYTVITHFASRIGLIDYNVHVIGVSNGGYQGIILATIMPQIKQLLCINMPLMINLQKSLLRLQTLENVEKTFVYGTKDPSHPYIPFLERKYLNKCRIVSVENADHQFNGMLDIFINLSDLILNQD